jgi:hypothetical protein
MFLAANRSRRNMHGSQIDRRTGLAKRVRPEKAGAAGIASAAIPT